MRDILRLLIIIVTASSSFIGVGRQELNRTQNLQSSFSLTIKAEQSQVRSGSALWVDATIKNKTDRTLSMVKALSENMDQGGWVYKVDVRDVNGALAPETKFGSRIEGQQSQKYGTNSSGIVFPLKSGGTIKNRVNINKLYDLTYPGRYTIQFRDFDPETKTFVKSNPITVTVTP